MYIKLTDKLYKFNNQLILIIIINIFIIKLVKLLYLYLLL